MKNSAAEDCCKQWFYNHTNSFGNESHKNYINHPS